MKTTIQHYEPEDRTTFDFFAKIERQVSYSWIYLHTNVIYKIQKDKFFKGMEILKRYEEDYSYTKLLKVTLENEDGDFFIVYLNECKMLSGSSYYIVYKIRHSYKEFSAPSEPAEVIFFKN